MGAIAVGVGAIAVLMIVLFSRKVKNTIWKYAGIIGVIGLTGGILLRLFLS